MIKPLGKRVILKQIKRAETKGSFYVPEDKEKAILDEAEVVAIGSGELLKVGDKVLYSKYMVETAEREDETYLIIEEKNINAII